MNKSRFALLLTSGGLVLALLVSGWVARVGASDGTHNQVIVFSDEEGGLVGSRALIGELSSEALDVVSHSGKTVRDGIAAIGGDPENLSQARYARGQLKAYLQ